MANEPIPKIAAASLLHGVLSGEFDVGLFCGIGTLMAALPSGTRIEFVASLPHRICLVPGAISTVSPDPNSARPWQDWLMSREGQATWSSLVGTFPVRNDVPDPAIAREPWFAEDKAAQVAIDWEKFGKRQGDVIAEYRKDIQGG